MKRIVLSALLAAVFHALPACAQDHPNSHFAVEDVDLAANYTAIYANAPPQGGCGCFWMNGGSAEIAVANGYRVGLVGNFGVTTFKNIGANSGHDLTLTTYLVGPRYSLKEHSRLSVHAQGLLGAAHSSTNNSLDNAKTSFALTTGGGVDLRLQRRMSWRILQAEYLFTQIPNGVNDKQNQLRLSSGIVFHTKR